MCVEKEGWGALEKLEIALVGPGTLIWFYPIADERLVFLLNRLVLNENKRLQLFLSNKLLTLNSTINKEITV